MYSDDELGVKQLAIPKSYKYITVSLNHRLGIGNHTLLSCRRRYRLDLCALSQFVAVQLPTLRHFHLSHVNLRPFVRVLHKLYNDGRALLLQLRW